VTRRRSVLVAVGGTAGVGLAVAPFLLMHAYVRSFVAAATPDSGFNIFTLVAVACLLLAAGLGVVALVMLIARSVRILALAYLGGLFCGGVVDLLLGFTMMR
jgi:hypothetical protein